MFALCGDLLVITAHPFVGYPFSTSRHWKLSFGSRITCTSVVRFRSRSLLILSATIPRHRPPQHKTQAILSVFANMEVRHTRVFQRSRKSQCVAIYFLCTCLLIYVMYSTYRISSNLKPYYRSYYGDQEIAGLWSYSSLKRRRGFMM
jgi:hypothetical protein